MCPVFQFIYSFLDPKCSIARDDVPKVFKQMGYPFTITKSSMCSVGSPHTWPTLLAGLDWLIDLIKVTPRLHRQSGEFLGWTGLHYHLGITLSCRLFRSKLKGVKVTY